MTDLQSAFTQRFGSAPHCVWAPGRVNLIGDHVDYCGGRVLPMPIQFGTRVAVSTNARGRVRAESLARPERLDFALGSAPSLPQGHWGRFVVGALAVSEGWGARGVGVDLLVAGDIPGSGLSSSASLSVALLVGLATLAGNAISGIALARAAQRIEHEHVGVRCGLMDQAVIALGQPDSALLFDCATHGCRSVRVPRSAPAIVVLDSGKARSLAQSGYNARHAETRAAATALGVPHQHLAAADPGGLDHIDSPLLRRRAAHVLAEQQRVDAAAIALERSDWPALGRLFIESHASLRDDFEVSCGEIDALVEVCLGDRGCLGARMTGAGFGGAVVALIERDGLDARLQGICSAYERRTGLSARPFEARSRGGAQVDG